MSERKKIKVEVDYVDFEYMNLAAVKSQINDWLSRYGEEAFFEFVSNRYDEGQTLKLFVNREETDEEMTKRLNEEKYYADLRLQRDRQLYEELKKRFDVC